MKVLVTGPRGMLGQEVVRVFAKAHTVIQARHDEVDITNADQTAKMLALKDPEIVINCAAYTNVDACETDSAKAYSVNGLGVEILARACARSGAKLLHISTDYVFDGTKRGAYTEDDAPHPLSVYGKSKLAGERFIQESLDDYIIVRTEWLYGRHGSHFAGKILDVARQRDWLEVVDDQTGSPTFTVDLAEAIQALLSCGARGIYHVTNAGSCTWYGFAKSILALAGMQTRVEPVSSERLDRPAKRPKNSVLDCEKFYMQTGQRLRPWTQALEEYMRERPTEQK
jgi:dTDP-4-dehydrorhamnose reductase